MRTNSHKPGKVAHGRFFDLIITLILLAVISAGLYFTLRPEQAETVAVEYNIVFETVDKRIASNISPNKIFLSEEGEHMGVIISALNDRKVFYTLDRSNGALGGYITNISDEYNTVIASVRADAIKYNGSYYVGGQPLRAGGSLFLRLPDFYGTATVTAVSVLEVE